MSPSKANAVVVMGVSGSGKTVIGKALADHLGWRFIEGDALHPPQNVERMSQGIPLTDELREGWLDAVGDGLAANLKEGTGSVAACSALKRIYRDRLRRIVPNLRFVHLDLDRETARERVGHRPGHFMPASLVESQFATLEPPQRDEIALVIDASRPAADIITVAATWLTDAN